MSLPCDSYHVIAVQIAIQALDRRGYHLVAIQSYQIAISGGSAPCVGGDGRFRLDRLTPRAGACVSVARALRAGRAACRLELYPLRMH
eukprot:1207452-Prymnesium_polylepis.1